VLASKANTLFPVSSSLTFLFSSARVCYQSLIISSFLFLVIYLFCSNKMPINLILHTLTSLLSILLCSNLHYYFLLYSCFNVLFFYFIFKFCILLVEIRVILLVFLIISAKPYITFDFTWWWHCS
jgi:hypothetical protein